MGAVSDLISQTFYRLGLEVSFSGISRASTFKPSRAEKSFSTALESQAIWKLPTLAEYDAIYADSPLYRVWKGIPDGDKWLHYFPIYDKHLRGFVDAPIRLLEIGVFRGASLRMWRQYFSAAERIVGVDINPDCEQYEDEAQGIHVEIGSQSDPAFLGSVVEKHGPFDVIIDDGSHVSSHMIETFNALFLDGLADRGVFVLEDTHCCYWESNRDLKHSMMDYVYALSDLMHRHHFELQRTPHYTMGRSRRKLRSNRIAHALESIHIHDSMVVMEKNSAKRPPVWRGPEWSAPARDVARKYGIEWEDD